MNSCDPSQEAEEPTGGCRQQLSPKVTDFVISYKQDEGHLKDRGFGAQGIFSFHSSSADLMPVMRYIMPTKLSL